MLLISTSAGDATEEKVRGLFGVLSMVAERLIADHKPKELKVFHKPTPSGCL
jgi:hypothetical protein